MSTTFAVKIPSSGLVKPVARRIGVGNGEVHMWFTEPLAELLPPETPLISMDNTSQKILTVGDIINHINKKQ
jgi:hypothetical protein